LRARLSAQQHGEDEAGEQAARASASPNAVRTQVWTAIAVYMLVAILKKRLHLNASLYTILQILSLTLFLNSHHHPS